MAKRWVAVCGDKTTSQPPGSVVANQDGYTINDQRVACEGDTIHCPACGVIGRIICVPPRQDQTWLGRRVALHGDLCACACDPKPRINVVSHQLVYHLVDDDEWARAQGLDSARQELEYYFVALHDDGTPADLVYRIDSDETKLHEGPLNARGETIALPLTQAGEVIFWKPAK